MTHPEDPQQRAQDPDPEQRYRAILALPAERLDLLLSGLSDESWRVRKAAVERLVGLPTPAAAVPGLLDLLASEDDAGARNAAAEALSRLVPHSTGPLCERLSHPDPALRKFAADILGEARSGECVGALILALADPDGNVRCSAAEALGKIGGPEALKALEGSLASPDRALQLAALDGLGRAGAAPPLAVLAPLSRDRFLRRQALRLLGRLPDRQAQELLLEALTDPSRSHREAALGGLWLQSGKAGERAAHQLARSLQQLGGDPRGLLDRIRESMFADDLDAARGAVLILGILNDPRSVEPLARAGADERLAAEVGQALARLGPAAGPPLLKAMPSLPPASRPLALLTLARVRERAATPMLLSYATDGAEAEREAAVEGLGEMGDVSAVPALVGLLSDELLASRAIRALTALGRIDREGVRLACEPLLAGPGAAAALRVLAGVGGDDEVERLKTALRSEYAEVRLAATEALRVLRHPAAEEVLRVALADEASRVRAGAARGLGAFCSDETIQALIATLKDREPTVAAAAAESLGALGDPLAVPALAVCVTRGSDAPGSPEVLPALAAVKALSRLSAANAEVLLRAIAHRDPEVVKEAVGAAALAPEAGEVLLSAALHSRWDVRRAAAQALATRGDRAVLPTLRRLADAERDPLAREAFQAAVKALEARPR